MKIDFFLVIKTKEVKIVKEVISCDVSPVAMFVLWTRKCGFCKFGVPSKCGKCNCKFGAPIDNKDDKEADKRSHM